MLDIPCAKYHLAVCKGIEGVLSEPFLPPGSSFYPANTLFAMLDREYDGARFKQVRYKLLVTLHTSCGISSSVRLMGNRALWSRQTQ